MDIKFILNPPISDEAVVMTVLCTLQTVPVKRSGKKPSVKRSEKKPSVKKTIEKVRMRHTTHAQIGLDGKNTGLWTDEEHQQFLDGMEKYGREWRKVAEILPTRTPTQIRSHAQKFLLKL